MNINGTKKNIGIILYNLMKIINIELKIKANKIINKIEIGKKILVSAIIRKGFFSQNKRLIKKLKPKQKL